MNAQSIIRYVLLSSLALSCACGGRAIPPVGETPPPPDTADWRRLVSEANAALDANDHARAADLLERSLDIQPDNDEVLRGLGQAHLSMGHRARARDWLLRALDRREDEATRNLLGYLEQTDGNAQDAAAHFERTIRRQQDNLYALVHLGLAYQQMGREQDAIPLLEKANSLDPDRANEESLLLDYYLGLAYEEARQYGRALDSYAAAARHSPNDAEMPRRAGRIRELLGDWEAAYSEYTRAYGLDPADAWTAAKLDELASFTQGEFADDTDGRVPAVVIVADDVAARIAAAPDAVEYPASDAVVLLSRSQHEILPDGRSRFSTHHVAKLLHRRAIAEYGEIAVPYNSVSQNIAVNVARTHLPDGTVVDVDEDGIRDVTPPETLAYNLYSDILWKVISFPALRAGAIVQYLVTVEDAVGRGNTDNLWFWGGMTFQGAYPTLRSEYALRVPEGVTFEWKPYRCGPKLSVTERADAAHDARTHVWAYPETPAAVFEPNAPPFEDTAPRFAFSSVESWESLHDWYRDLLADRFVLDSTVGAEFDQWLASASTQRERIAALAQIVARDVRYVAIQLGEGAYRPHAAATVMERRYGDCKDKCGLLITMLGGIGVTAYPALISPSPSADVDRDLPSLGQFSHMIVAVPDDAAESGYVWFDPTDDTLPFERLPARDQGRRALLIHQDGPEWRTTPVDAPHRNRYDWTLTLEPLADGAVRGQEALVATGTHASDLRRSYGAVPDAAMGDFLVDTMSSAYPGIQLDEWEVDGVETPGSPVRVSVTFTAPGYVLASGTRRVVPVPGFALEEYASIVASDSRQYPIELGVPNTLTRTCVVMLPEGAEPVDPLAALTIRNAFGELERRVTEENGELTYSMTLTIRTPTIGVDDYDKAQRFFRRLAREERAELAYRLTASGSGVDLSSGPTQRDAAEAH